MRIEPPLSNLLERCMTLCVAECCGIDAYDIHPIHVASYLLLYTGAPDLRDVERVRAQLDALQANYGSAGASGRGATFEQLNQGFSGPEIDAFVDRVKSALDGALSLLVVSQAADKQRASSRTNPNTSWSCASPTRALQSSGPLPRQSRFAERPDRGRKGGLGR